MGDSISNPDSFDVTIYNNYVLLQLTAMTARGAHTARFRA